MSGRGSTLATLALLLWTALTDARPLLFGPVLPLHITRAANTEVDSCTLIAREDQPGGVTLYFVTAAHLFVASADRRVHPISAVLIDPAGRHLVVRTDDVVLPSGTLVDLALLRATAAASDLRPQPLSFVALRAGDSFTISGVGEDGTAVDVPEHVRFVSTLFAIGDRDPSRLAGCVGAAASTAAGTFGVVTGCAPGKAPRVTLLDPARAFLERHIRSLQNVRPTS